MGNVGFVATLGNRDNHDNHAPMAPMALKALSASSHRNWTGSDAIGYAVFGPQRLTFLCSLYLSLSLSLSLYIYIYISIYIYIYIYIYRYIYIYIYIYISHWNQRPFCFVFFILLTRSLRICEVFHFLTRSFCLRFLDLFDLEFWALAIEILFPH